MTRLAVEYERRMLGNGWCNRPTQLDKGMDFLDDREKECHTGSGR